MRIEDLRKDYWVIYQFSNEKNIDLFPVGCSFINYRDLFALRDKLPFSPPKSIILTTKFIPAKLESLCGYILAYIKNGGKLIIHGPSNTGRTGTNRQYYNWIPQDFECLNFLPNGNWTFDIGRLSDFNTESPIHCVWIRPTQIINKSLPRFAAKYGDGFIIFEGMSPSREVYKNIFREFPLSEVPDFSSSPSWKWRHVAQLNRDENIRSEGDIYGPGGPLTNIFMTHLGFELSETFSNRWLTGIESFFIDICTVYPAISLWEVDSIGTGGTSGESTSIGIGHACKTPVYGNRAKEQYSMLIKILRDNAKSSIDAIKTIIDTSGLGNCIMKEFFHKYLKRYFDNYDAFDSVGFINFIKNSNNIIGGYPIAVLIGTSYGFIEGEKESAREIAKREEYSLWTYRDLYEFLIRTDHLPIQERRMKMLLILGKRCGPVYKEIGKL